MPFFFEPADSYLPDLLDLDEHELDPLSVRFFLFKCRSDRFFLTTDNFLVVFHNSFLDVTLLDTTFK
jgi:hypothetical protein